jgi:hypothetical protein
MPNTKRIKTNNGGKMKIYKTQAEVESDIKDRILRVNDNVKIECNISINAIIICRNLNCRNLNCWDFNCRNLNCWNLNCMDLNCKDLDCRDLNCENLNCRNLSYYAVAFAYESFKCKSVKGRRNNSKHFCLDSEVKIKGDR